MRPRTVPQMPIVGGKTACRLEYGRLTFSLFFEEGHIVLEEFRKCIRIRAIDDITKSLLNEGVLLCVERLEVLLEGKEAIAPRFLGEGDEHVGYSLLIGHRIFTGRGDELGDGKNLIKVIGEKEGAEGAAEYDDEGRREEKASNITAFKDEGNDQGKKAKKQSYNTGDIHKPSARLPGTILRPSI